MKITVLVALASVLTSGAVAEQVEARTIVTNANGYTLDDLGRIQRFTTLILDDNGKVEGTRTEAGDLPSGIVVDAKGATLLPGLIDAHTHIMGLGEQLLSLDLGRAETLDEAVQMIAGYAGENPDGWLLGGGWNQVSWGMQDFPAATDLDRVTGDRPAAFSRVDGHALWVNSAALRAAGIDDATPDPDGGQIRRDADGRATGILVDNAMQLVETVLPPVSDAVRAARLQAALQAMAAAGLTGAADMGTTPADWRTFKSFAEDGRLTARIGAYARPYESFVEIAATEQPGWQYADHLALAGVKLVVDGALGSRGAAMLEPYSDAPGERGLFIDSGARLRNAMAGAATRGYQVAVHAIGDAANREALDAFADLQNYLPQGRNRIEHVQVVAPEDMNRLAELGLIASIQPTHATSDMAMAEDRIGAERLKGAYAWRQLANSGARLALGSDFPVEPVQPLYGMHAAVTRKNRAGEPEGGWVPQEALTSGEALAGFTIDAAYAMKLDNSVGTLTSGKWADFILIDGDPIVGAADDIWKLKVLETWVGGKKVFDADDEPSIQ